MRSPHLPLLALALAAPACARAHAQSDSPPAQPAPAAQPARPAPAPPAAAPAQLDPDGNDDPEDPGTGALPAIAHFERVGRPPLALRRVCDLTPHGDSLYAAHANAPLGSDGATITRYTPGAQPRAMSVAFDWNRPGQPTRGGGAGQGFVRVHNIHGRLFVPDADPPYNGFGISENGTEGFVFVSDPGGNFAPARGANLRPPGRPDPVSRAGAAVLPRAYHDLDVISYRGRMYASTGSVPPHERAWYGPGPGALHVANADWSRWTYEVDYPYPWRNGTWRLGYLVRFRDRLYAGIQDYDGREPNDFVYFDPPRDAPAIRREDTHPVRLSPEGASLTLRWYADAGRLYWIALLRGWSGTLRVTDDGDHWREIAVPPEVGRPTDIVRFRDALVVLTERGLYRLDGEALTLVARVDGPRSPFAINDIFCAAPLAVFRNELYAGGQRDGALYRLVEGPAPAPAPASNRR